MNITFFFFKHTERKQHIHQWHNLTQMITYIPESFSRTRYQNVLGEPLLLAIEQKKNFFFYKQLYNWAKCMKHKFSDIGHQSKLGEFPWGK